MKKTFFSFFLILILCSSLCLSISLNEVGDDYNGAPEWFYLKEKSKVFSLSSLAVVGNYLCSTSPDWSSSGGSSGSLVNSDQICWTNKDGGSPGGNGIEHGGVIYQIWQTTKDGNDVWIQLHPTDYVSGHGFKIDAGYTQCVGVTSGERYYRQAFYCDDVSKSCSTFQPVCKYESSTKMQRYCTPGGREETIIDYIEDSNLPFCSDYNPPNTKPPVNPSPPSSGLSGEWSRIAVENNVKSDSDINVRGVFKAKVDGTYLLEAGIVDTPIESLSLVNVPKGSRCNNDTHWSGNFFELKAGQEIELNFNFEGRTKSGIYSVIIGAYSGCLSDGGKIISVTDRSIKVGGGLLDNDGKKVGGGLLDNDGKLIWLILAIVSAIGIYWYWRKK